jgi:hypothetical protein
MRKPKSLVFHKSNVEWWNYWKKTITSKDLKKITIKIMRLKIKIKNKLEGKNNSLIEGLNWKQKKIKKGQKNQNIGTKLEKNKT